MGILGAAASDCDSPVALINATFQWINDTIKDDIDFIIWTGDSARHDNDENYPRTEDQVTSLNELLVDKFVQVFGKDDNNDDADPTNDLIIPIVPTFGNNDILPHNIFSEGPNKWTKRYTSIWRKFIPEAQRHSFERGGWYFTEVIPNKLAVFSLNTLYFFDSNSAVDGCDSKSEPGYEHFEWLDIQLQFLRERGMKAILTGHVPPARTKGKQSWEESCWQKYTLWMRQYRDVVIGGVWGHMNIDHFMLQDSKEVKALHGQNHDDQRVSMLKDKDVFTVQGSTSYLQELRDNFQDLPERPAGIKFSDLNFDDDDTAGPVEINKKKGKKDKKGKKGKGKKSKKEKREEYLKKVGGKWAERFSLSLVSPSIVPNYFPTLRIVEYNITGLEDSHVRSEQENQVHDELRKRNGEVKVENESEKSFDSSDLENSYSTFKKKQSGKKKGKDKEDKNYKSKKPKHKIPKPPSKTSPPGPGYSPQTLSWLSYTQYYANITSIDAAISAAARSLHTSGPIPSEKKKKKQEELVKEYFKFQVEYSTRNYSTTASSSKHDEEVLPDLTVRSYLDLAKKIGKKNKKGDANGKFTAGGDDWFDDLGKLIFEMKDEEDHDNDNSYEEELEDSPDNKSHDDDDINLFSDINIDTIASIILKKQKDLPDLSSSSLSTTSQSTSTNDYTDEIHDQTSKSKDKSKTKHKKNKKDKKHKKQKKKKDKTNHLWLTFAHRAFVGTKGEDELRELFD